MKTFEVKGTFEKNRETGKFTKTVHAISEKLATEKILTQLGGKQKIKRSKITIEEIKEAK